MDCTIHVAKTNSLISFAVTAKLICVFVFAYAKSRFSHDEAHIQIYSTSSRLGAATLIPRHLLLMAGMTLLVELQHRTSRQVAMYFSMVLRKACWASFDSLSTSVKTTTANEHKIYK